jgi:class 3 adenylate cyclase
MLEEHNQQLSQKRKQNADALYKQSRHIPKLLQSQILCHLVQQFLFSRNEKFMHHTDGSKAPLIQRFHGALLFVDISGFTSLSLKLDVDNLKNHINRYFTKMLNIVEKWGGDVIKFAGDALFIVWPTDIHAKGINLNNLKKEGGTIRGATIRSMMLKIGGGTGPAATANTEESRFAAAAKIAVEKAVACGLEICSECSHYEILLSGTAPNRGGMLQKFVPTWLIPAKVSPENSNVAYLDVHAGVSVGLMAAVDIGHRNRREYFLLGDPIKYAAEAEGKASKGEIVLCPRSHFILHRTEKDSLPTLYGDVDKEDKLEGHAHSHDHKKVPCGCMRLDHNYHCITKLNVSSLSTNTTTLDEKEAVETTPASPPKFTRGRSKSKLDLLISISETDADALMSRIAMELEKDLDKMLLVARPLMKRQFLAIVKKHLFPPVITAEDGEGSNKLTTQNPIQLTDEENIRLETTLSDLITSNLRDAFQCFVQQTLLDEVVKHVHDVVRDNYTFTREESMSAGITRETTLQSWMEYPLIHRSSEEEKLDINHLWMVYQTYEGPENQVKNKDSPDSPLKKQKSQGKLTRALSASVISDKAVKSAEIRTVIVLFMKVDGLDSNLLIDSSENRRLNGGGFARKPQNAFYDMYRFLDRTENEIASDNVLANRFQSCIEGIIESLSVYNGQLRQFIVDDKGTVAIGTFGLRGSVGSDNAASAIEAAQQIIDKLNVLKLSVSIGITTGRAYCGLVGSQNRHEFAVMGPSTNLSARLMGKTAPNSITCDLETKNSDRIHSFESTGEVIAKGYAQPVATYVPILKNSTIANASGGAAMNFFNQFSMSALVPTSRKINLLKRFQLSDHNKSYRHKNSNQKLNSLQDNTRNDEDYEYDGIPQFKEFIESSFFLPNDMNSILPNIRNSLRPPRQIKLYERNRNLISILSFLFPKDSNNNNSRTGITSSFRKKTITTITTTTTTATANLFDLTTPNRMITCCGTSGLGKTALLKSFTSKLSSFIMNKPKTFNLFIIQNRTKGINSKIPFHSWKIILMELLKIISQQSMNKANHANNNASKARSIRMVATVQKPNYHELLNSLLSEVSFKLESFTRDYIYQLFGLSSVHHIDLDSIEEKLTNSKAEYRSIALALFQLIQIMIKKLDKLLFLCM